MAVRRRARLEVPGTSARGVLRVARSVAGRERQYGVGQRATAAQERRMNRGCSVHVKVAKAPRLALRVGGLKIVQQLLAVQVCHSREQLSAIPLASPEMKEFRCW